MEFLGGIFDLDGTLLDSMGVWEQIDIDFLARRGFSVPEDYIKTITPMGFAAAAEYTIRRFHLNETPEDLIAEWKEMSIETYSSAIFLKPFAKEYLKHLKSSGVRLAVATASHEGLFVPALKNNGVYELFDAFVTVDEVPRGKGFPDVYEKAAERLSLLPEQCVVFEDIFAGIQGANAGNFLSVGVYEPRSKFEEEEIKRHSKFYIHDFKEALYHPYLG